LGVTSLVAGLMVFARAKSAGFMIRVTLVLAALCVVADVVVQGWLVVPALRRLAPSLKPPQATMYDPGLRPWLPIGVGLVVLAVLFGIGLALRRPHVRTALAANRPAVLPNTALDRPGPAERSLCFESWLAPGRPVNVGPLCGEESPVLDYESPKAPHIVAASIQLDLILQRCKLVTAEEHFD
jgi:hypothetical protein